MQSITPTKYKYQKRIVVFLDLLGFKEKLQEFEQEAIFEDEEEHVNYVKVSDKANDFINVFKDAISLIDPKECNYYLFSDNICLTLDPYFDKDLHIKVMFTISDLIKKFAEKGYFLRGGIDYGWFVDEKDVALGMPLVNAYLLESTKAIFPRVILSPSYKKLLDELETNMELDNISIFNKNNFLRESDNFTFINPFYNVITTSDKYSFFTQFKTAIETNLMNVNGKNILKKFEWLAIEYNTFLDFYVSNIETLEQEVELTNQEIESLKSLKINNLKNKCSWKFLTR